MSKCLSTVLEFQPISIEQKAKYEQCLAESAARGCEYSFANLYLWGEQRLAFWNGQALLFSRFDEHLTYPYPVGKGDKADALEALRSHAREKGIPFRLSGMLPDEKEALEAQYPNCFRYTQNFGSHDYVYAIDDLADLAGRKYHAKRNHCHRFEEKYPDWCVVPLDRSNLAAAELLAQRWFAEKESEDPNADFAMEKCAIARAIASFGALELEGLLLIANGEAVAMTMGNRMTYDTFDINFEKALSGIDGAYAIINRAFARYIRQKYPTVAFFNREEDMGIEGLRRAKLSYYPHHRVEKYKATWLGESN